MSASLDERDNDPWSWAQEPWQRAFEPLKAAGYTLERVDSASYWRLHKDEMHEHFFPEVFINTYALRSEAERAGQERLMQARGSRPLRDCCVVRRAGALVAMFTGHQHEDGAYRMHHSHVHPDFRRRGVYAMIARGTIDYTKELGFDRVVSEHSPANNGILIAKLKSGFRILSMDVDPMVGLSIRLCYYHNLDHLAAYEYRCGLASMNPRILAQGSGAIDTLVAQFRADPDTDE